MPKSSYTAQDVNGDPLTTGGNINIVNNSFTELSFEHEDGLGGDAVSVDGGAPQSFQHLGVGEVRGDPNQLAAFIRLDDGSTFAIDLDADGDGKADLQNGNTKLKVEDLEQGRFAAARDDDDDDDDDEDDDDDGGGGNGENPVCFTPGALIETPRGLRRVELLRPGDLVCADSGVEPVLWVGRSRHDFRLTPDPRQPVLIRAGALGPGLPGYDLILSPQHRLLISGPLLHARLGLETALAPAKALTRLPGIRRMVGRRRADYIAILLPRHRMLTVNGALAESFYPGPTALRMVGPVAADAISTALGRRPDDPTRGYGPPFAPALTCGQAEALARAARRQGGGLSFPRAPCAPRRRTG